MKVFYVGMIVCSETLKGLTLMWFGITDISIFQNKVRAVASAGAMVIHGINGFKFNPSRVGMDFFQGVTIEKSPDQTCVLPSSLTGSSKM